MDVKALRISLLKKEKKMYLDAQKKYNKSNLRGHVIDLSFESIKDDNKFIICSISYKDHYDLFYFTLLIGK